MNASIKAVNKTREDTYRRLLSSDRVRETSDKDRKNDPYLETISDTGRIVRSSPFRRLQGKAQVFSMARSGAVRTRLTHSIEVSNYGALIAESLARDLINKRSLPQDLRFPFGQNSGECLPTSRHWQSTVRSYGRVRHPNMVHGTEADIAGKVGEVR